MRLCWLCASPGSWLCASPGCAWLLAAGRRSGKRWSLEPSGRSSLLRVSSGSRRLACGWRSGASDIATRGVLTRARGDRRCAGLRIVAAAGLRIVADEGRARLTRSELASEMALAAGTGDGSSATIRSSCVSSMVMTSCSLRSASLSSEGSSTSSSRSPVRGRQALGNWSRMLHRLLQQTATSRVSKESTGSKHWNVHSPDWKSTRSPCQCRGHQMQLGGHAIRSLNPCVFVSIVRPQAPQLNTWNRSPVRWQRCSPTRMRWSPSPRLQQWRLAPGRSRGGSCSRLVEWLLGRASANETRRRFASKRMLSSSSLAHSYLQTGQDKSALSGSLT